MKKGENITLLIGIICNFTIAVWQLMQFIYHSLTVLTEKNIKYFLNGDILPVAIIFLLMIFPVVLLVQNLKNKTGKLIPIISIIINSTVLLWILFLSFTPAIPQYLIYSKLRLIDTYFIVILRFLENGGLLFVVGYAALIIGSFLSFPKNKKQKTIDDENTTVIEN